MKVLSYFCQSQNITREKLRKALLNKKGTSKMLMKLTPVLLRQPKSVTRFEQSKTNMESCSQWLFDFPLREIQKKLL